MTAWRALQKVGVLLREKRAPLPSPASPGEIEEARRIYRAG